MRSLRQLESGLVEDVLRNYGAVENNGVVDEKPVFTVGLDKDREPAGLGRSVITSPLAAVSGANIWVGVLARSKESRESDHAQRKAKISFGMQVCTIG